MSLYCVFLSTFSVPSVGLRGLREIGCRLKSTVYFNVCMPINSSLNLNYNDYWGIFMILIKYQIQKRGEKLDHNEKYSFILRGPPKSPEMFILKNVSWFVVYDLLT